MNKRWAIIGELVKADRWIKSGMQAGDICQDKVDR